MTALSFMRVLLVAIALTMVAGAAASAYVQTQRWEDVDPAVTNRILWYSTPILYVLLAAVLAGAAVRPGRKSMVAVLSTALLFFVVSMLPWGERKHQSRLMMAGVTAMLAGTSMHRILTDQHG